MNEMNKLERMVLCHVLDIYRDYYRRHRSMRFSVLKYGLVDAFNALCDLYLEDPEFYSDLLIKKDYRRLLQASREYYLDRLRDPNHDEREAALLASDRAPNFERYLSRMKETFPLFADYRDVRHFFAQQMQCTLQKAENAA